MLYLDSLANSIEVALLNLGQAEGRIRLEKLRDIMDKENLSLLAVTDPSHNKWLIGTPFVICTVVPLDGAPLVFHHPTEYDQVKHHVWLDHEEEIANLLDKDLVTRLWEGELKISSWMDPVQRKVLEKFNTEASSNKTVVWKARSVKTQGELVRIRKSCEICKEMMGKALSCLSLGSTGRDIQTEANDIGSELIERKRGEVEVLYPHAHPGGFYHEFDVLSGEETAYPHAETTNREIRKNEPISLSCAVKFDEYWSEFGITTFLGEPDEEIQELSQITKEAHRAAIGKCKIGSPIYLVDKAAREVFDSYGLWNFCGGATGHSIGLESQELPSIWPPIRNFLSKEPLRRDQVFSIEPGLSIPSKYGFLWKTMIRISDRTQILADPFQI